MSRLHGAVSGEGRRQAGHTQVLLVYGGRLGPRHAAALQADRQRSAQPQNELELFVPKGLKSNARKFSRIWHLKAQHTVCLKNLSELRF